MKGICKGNHEKFVINTVISIIKKMYTLKENMELIKADKIEYVLRWISLRNDKKKCIIKRDCTVYNMHTVCALFVV